MKSATLGLAASLALALSSACLSNDLATEERFTETGVGFGLKGPFSNLTLTISGPNDFHASAFSRDGAPAIDLRQFGAVEDGTYAYQLTAATDERVKVRTKLDNGRDGTAAADPLKSVTASGTFNVRGGVIVKRQPSTGRRDRQ